jgi:hypothetical protein
MFFINACSLLLVFFTDQEDRYFIIEAKAMAHPGGYSIYRLFAVVTVA